MTQTAQTPVESFETTSANDNYGNLGAGAAAIALVTAALTGDEAIAQDAATALADAASSTNVPTPLIEDLDAVAGPVEIDTSWYDQQAEGSAYEFTAEQMEAFNTDSQFQVQAPSGGGNGLSTPDLDWSGNVAGRDVVFDPANGDAYVELYESEDGRARFSVGADGRSEEDMVGVHFTFSGGRD